jgi:hypothetical protein
MGKINLDCISFLVHQKRKKNIPIAIPYVLIFRFNKKIFAFCFMKNGAPVKYFRASLV